MNLLNCACCDADHHAASYTTASREKNSFPNLRQIYPEFFVTAREFFKTIKDDFQNNN